MQKLTFTSISKILDKRSRRKLWGLAVARIGANLLDLIGLAGIALLATSFSSLAAGSSTRSPLAIPGLGELVINETQAVLIASAVALVFLLKSGFSIWLNLLTSLAVAELEGRFSAQLAGDFFSSEKSSSESETDSVAEFQNRILYSTNAISAFLNARLTFIAESSLLLALVTIFLAVNPIASLSMFAFMGTVLFALNRMIGFRILRNGELQLKGYEISLQTSRDLFGVKREAISSGVAPGWLARLAQGRTQAAQGYALIYTLNSLPRYVIETSLVLGILAFLGGVVIFSDLSAQAVTIGVFMAGGLRLVASLLPLQFAFNQMQDGANRGEPAFNALLQTKISSEALAIPKHELVGVPAILLENVCYTYPGSDSSVIEGVSFEVAPRTKVAIVGPSGAGKSTIFDLITGFREPSTGTITVGELSPRKVLLGSPGTFGIVTQRPHLVTGSILENVSLVEDSLTDRNKVQESLARAGLGHFTVSANWFEMLIRPDSGQLSGGEIQRLGLARALYRDPTVLLLDEATSALDAETESQITKVLHELKKDMTIVLIAHRLSTVLNADKIIYLDGGKVVAQGTFAELKALVPDFAKAVDLMDLNENK